MRISAGCARFAPRSPGQLVATGEVAAGLQVFFGGLPDDVVGFRTSGFARVGKIRAETGYVKMAGPASDVRLRVIAQSAEEASRAEGPAGGAVTVPNR